MRWPWMTTRLWMIAVAIVGLVLGAVIVTGDLERSAILHHQQAEYHRWMEDQSRTRAIHLESLARDPSRYRDLLEILSRTRTRWKERALEARLELMDDEDGHRAKRWYPEAREVATCQWTRILTRLLNPNCYEV